MHVDNYLDTINKWKNCPMANYVCPVARYTKAETNTPRGLAFIFSLITSKLKKIDNTAIERIYQCNLCRACEAVSRDDSSIPEFIIAARMDIVEGDMVPKEVRKLTDDIVKDSILSNFESVKNIVSESNSTEDTVLIINYKSENSKKIFQKIKKLLTKENIDCKELNIGKYPAPAVMLNELGYNELSNKVLENLVYLIKNFKFKELVFLVPYDLELLIKNEVINEGLSDIKHSFEFLNEFIEKYPDASKKKNEEIIYIDSEGNRKNEKFYEIPRKILKDISGYKIKEMIWNRKESISCGGLVLKYLYPDIFNGILNIIFEELDEYNLDKIITPCPDCIDNLAENKNLKKNFKFLDLWEASF